MIGHMQGKFQLAVVPGVGHMLQEVRNVIPLYYSLLSANGLGRPDETRGDFGRVLEKERKSGCRC
jgi:hypothetical protein